MFKNIPNVFSKKAYKKADKNSASFYKFKNPNFFYIQNRKYVQKTISRYRPWDSAATA